MKHALLLLAVLLLLAPCQSLEARQTAQFTFAERGDVVGKLYRLGLQSNPGNVPTFCEALQDKNPAVREAAVAQLVFTHNDGALEPVIRSMRDESRLVRRSAIAVLDRIGSRRAIPSLVEALAFRPADYKANETLRPEEYFNRLAAALALHRLGSDAGRDAVLEILRTSQEKPVLCMALLDVILMDLKDAVPDCIRIARDSEYIGEDSPGLFALRAIWYVADDSQRDEIVKLALEKSKSIGMHAPIWSQALLVKFGGPEHAQLFKDTIIKTEEHEQQLQCILGLQKFPCEGASEAIIKHVLPPKAVITKTNEIGWEREYKVFEMGCAAVGALGDKSVIPLLKETYTRYTVPDDWFSYRLHVAWALARLGDPEGLDNLHKALSHQDAAVRRLAAQLLTKQFLDQSSLPLLLSAIKKESEPTAFDAMKLSIEKFGYHSVDVAFLPTPKAPPVPKDTYGKPRFMHFWFDDCATPASLERFSALAEDLATHDVRWAFTMFYAPLSRYDYEYNTVLVQRLFDRGCEIENHTLRHDPDGLGVYHSTDDELRAEIGGNNNWIRSHILGADKIYRWYSGGGQFTRPGDPTRARRDVLAIIREANFATDVPAWWKAPAFNDWDLCAPPFHPSPRFGKWAETETPKGPRLMTARSQGDLRYAYDGENPAERIRAFAASVDYWYFNHPETILMLGGHDWPNSSIPDRPGNETHWEILSGGIKEVLLNQKDRHPMLHAMTYLELSYVINKKADVRDLLSRKSNLQTESK